MPFWCSLAVPLIACSSAQTMRKPPTPVATGPHAAGAVAWSPAQTLPAPNAEPSELPGLDVAQVSPIVLKSYGAVGGCHTIEHRPAADAPTTEGFVTVDWVIQPDGSVREAAVTSSSYNQPRLHACVVAVTENLRFPSAVGTTPVSWRFKFRRQAESQGPRATLR